MAQNVDRLADLVPDILSRLPVKSLMRFKCVNKPWYNLIKNPNFISKHLHAFNNHVNFTNHTINLLVNRTRRATFGPSGLNRKAFISLLSFDTATNNSSLNLLDLIYNHNEVTHIDIFGPCNGLYCLYGSPILIINPSMREFRVLPDTHLPPETYCMQHFPGFGFDAKTNEYKLVLIMDTWRQDTDERLPWRVEIYTLSSNCWRKVDCPLPSVSIWNRSWIDAFVHGVFHWWGYDTAGDLILAFDMHHETFRTIRLPNLRSSTQEFAGTVTKFKESLAVIVYPRRGTQKCFELWVMEDYGNEGSWTKHSIIGPIVGAKRPLGFWKNDLFMLEDNNGRMVFYDLQTEEIKHTGFHGEGGSLQGAVYMESLVSLRRDNEQYQAGGASSFNMIPDPLFDGNAG